MRLVLSVLAVLALTAGPARADVFLPADPDQASASRCAAAAGEVYAARVRGALQASVVGGAPVAVPGDCPLVAGAADGTAAVAGSSLVVRRSGQGFGAPIALGEETASVLAVAAAPGGWAVALSEQDDELAALIVRPDGTTARTVVDRAALPGDAHVGIDASGRVTIAWWRYERRMRALRVGRFSAGSPVVSAEVPESESSVAAVAVAPGGSSLVAWTTQGGVHAMLDGGAPVVLDAVSGDVAALSASLAEDGTALIAYLRQRDELVTVERLGGTWQPPRVLWSSAQTRYGPGNPESLRVLTTLAPGGRAVTAWATGGEGESTVLAALGQAGNWSPPTRLSSITREARLTSLAPDAAGVPRVLWVELGLGVRGATVAPAPADVTAPAVSARFPARLARTRDAA